MKNQHIPNYVDGIRDEFILEAEPKALAALQAEQTAPQTVLLTPIQGKSAPRKKAKRRLPLAAAIAAAFLLTLGLGYGACAGVVSVLTQSGAVSVTANSPMGHFLGGLFPFLQPDETEPPYEVTIRDLDDVTEPTETTVTEETTDAPETETEPADPCALGHSWIVTNQPSPTACYTDERIDLACMQCGQTESTAETGHIYMDGYCQICHMIEGAFEGFYVIVKANGDVTEGHISGHATLPEDDVLILPNYYYDKTYGMVPITEIVLVDLHLTKATKVVIPEGIRTIQARALNDSQTVTEIILPDTLITIGDEAFRNSVALKEIRMSQNVRGIGSRCFQGCAALTSIELPDTLETMAVACFENCSALQTVSISGKLTYIPSYTFRGCLSLKQLTLPDGLTRIGDSAFCACGSLEQLTLPDGLTRIEDGAFHGCQNLKVLALPDSLVEIGSQAFAYSGIEVLIIPPALEHLGDEAFMYSGLKEVRSQIMNSRITLTLGTSVFRYCNQLTWVDLAGSRIQTLPDYTFCQCTSLLSIVLPDVTSIGSGAFGGCRSLTELELPASLSDIADETVFEMCIALNSLSVREGCERYTVKNGCLIDKYTSTLLLATDAAVIPDDGSVTVIATDAFSYRQMESVVIPKGVTVLGEFSFYSCEQLRSVTIPASVTRMDLPYIFAHCQSLTDIYYGGTVAEWEALTDKQPISFNTSHVTLTVHCVDGTIT